MRGESIWNAIGALVVILPLLYFAFRSPWLVAVGAVPSALSVLIVMAAYAWLGHPAVGGRGRRRGDAVRARHRRRRAAVRRLPSRRPRRRRRRRRRRISPGPALSMLLGMWTTAATFYGLAVVDFPSLEELGLLIGHSMMVCGVLTLVLVPALLPATPPAVVGAHHLLAAAAVVRRARPDPRRRGGDHGRAPPSPRRACASIRRSIGCAPTSPAAAFEAEVTTRFGVPRDVYLVVDQGPALEPLLEANERLVAALAPRGARRRRGTRRTSLLPSARDPGTPPRRGSRRRASRRPASRPISRRRPPRRGFRPGTFDRFAATLPVLLDTARAAHLRRLRRARPRRPARPLDRAARRRSGRWSPTSTRPRRRPSTACAGRSRRLAARRGCPGCRQ